MRVGDDSPAEDHPRSRGVYHVWDMHVTSRHGSSPLARGLPSDGRATNKSGRIIPARAGFTIEAREYSPGREDHPRSRGVYFSAALSWTRAAGSSPLARGLLGDDRLRTLAQRIIPARAGFTSDFVFVGENLQDHPRSRGVYNDAGFDTGNATGSSPLARGLHKRTLRLFLGRWIIPARAGFTK